MSTPQTPIHSGFDGMTASKPEAELRMNLLFIIPALISVPVARVFLLTEGQRAAHATQNGENKNGQTQAFGRSERLSSFQASMSSRMNFSTLHFAPSYP